MGFASFIQTWSLTSAKATHLWHKSASIRDKEQSKHKFCSFSAEESLEGYEKLGLTSGQIIGSTWFWAFALLGSSHPPFFGMSVWIPLQDNGEQHSFEEEGLKTSGLYQSVLLVCWTCLCARNMMSSKGCCVTPSQAQHTVPRDLRF